MQPSVHYLLPANEAERVQALHRYGIMGTAPESLFDDLAALTARLFNVPISLVSFVEEDSVWFKSNFGLEDIGRVERNSTLCSVAIMQNDGATATVFEDLQTAPCELIDSRLLNSLGLRFYASQTIQTTDGFNIGVFCIVDRQARSFSPDEQLLLKHLADTVMLLLELRRANAAQLPASVLQEPLPQPFAAVPPLINQLKHLADIGSTGTTVDMHGAPVATEAIYVEADHLTKQLNHTLAQVLAS